MGIKGRIHSVESFGTLDGPGIRYVLFLQGCSLRCLYCHNPDTWEPGGGTETDSDDVMKDIWNYRSFIKTGGVTLSGGEPLQQAEFVLDIIKKCAEQGIHTAIDTSGAVPLAQSRPALDAADLILLDIKSLDDTQNRLLTGCGNTDTLATLAYCESIGKTVWLRHVLVPGYTLDIKRLEALAEYLSHFTCIEKVELLPFHKMGEYKWRKLRIPYQLSDTPVPSPGELTHAQTVFERHGLNCLMKE